MDLQVGMPDIDYLLTLLDTSNVPYYFTIALTKKEAIMLAEALKTIQALSSKDTV